MGIYIYIQTPTIRLMSLSLIIWKTMGVEFRPDRTYVGLVHPPRSDFLISLVGDPWNNLHLPLLVGGG